MASHGKIDSHYGDGSPRYQRAYGVVFEAHHYGMGDRVVMSNTPRQNNSRDTKRQEQQQSCTYQGMCQWGFSIPKQRYTAVPVRLLFRGMYVCMWSLALPHRSRQLSCIVFYREGIGVMSSCGPSQETQSQCRATNDIKNRYEYPAQLQQALRLLLLLLLLCTDDADSKTKSGNILRNPNKNEKMAARDNSKYNTGLQFWIGPLPFLAGTHTLTNSYNNHQFWNTWYQKQDDK